MKLITKFTLAISYHKFEFIKVCKMSQDRGYLNNGGMSSMSCFRNHLLIEQSVEVSMDAS